jgi:diguanylate cyclase (GGDEF)-like protein
MMASSISLSAGVIFPVIVLIALTAGYLASRISTPLTRLARVTEKFPADEKLKNILNINVWYYEAKILRKAVYKSLRAMQYTVSRLNNDAMTDQLTALYNRRGLVEKMRDLSTNNNIIIMLDIDNFKHINDKYGHDIGDRTLVTLAKRLKSLCRSSDIISRFGGEEFVVVLPGCPFDTGVTIAERIRFGVSGYHDEGIPVFTVSVGVCGMTEMSSEQVDQAIKLADIALYAAKEAGRNCVVTNHNGQLRRYPQGNLLVQPPQEVVVGKATSKI